MPLTLDRYQYDDIPAFYETCTADSWRRSERIEYLELEPPRSSEERPSLKPEFDRLAKKWREETSGFSVTAQKYAHPAYHAILVLGAAHVNEIVPLILQELQARPGRWFEALKLLTNEDPTKPNDSFDD